MRVDLSATQLAAMERGQFTAPDGAVFARRSTRTKRRTCDDAIAQGSPVVLYYWAASQFEWLDADDALEEWQRIRRHVVTGDPRTGGDTVWTAGVWEAGDRTVLVLTGHC